MNLAAVCNVINKSNSLYVFAADKGKRNIYTRNSKRKCKKTCKKLTFPLEEIYLNHIQYQDSPNHEDTQK